MVLFVRAHNMAQALRQDQHHHSRPWPAQTTELSPPSSGWQAQPAASRPNLHSLAVSSALEAYRRNNTGAALALSIGSSRLRGGQQHTTETTTPTRQSSRPPTHSLLSSSWRDLIQVPATRALGFRDSGCRRHTRIQVEPHVKLGSCVPPRCALAPAVTNLCGRRRRPAPSTAPLRLRCRLAGAHKRRDKPYLS